MRVGEISTEPLILRQSDQDRDDLKILMMLYEEDPEKFIGYAGFHTSFVRRSGFWKNLVL